MSVPWENEIYEKNSQDLSKKTTALTQHLTPVTVTVMKEFKGRLYVPKIQKFHYHHLVVPSARISQTLSCHFSLSFIASGRSSGLLPVSSPSCCILVLLLHGNVKGSIGLHHLWARPYNSSSVLHVWFV